jgi:hypothetical protein
VEHVAGEDGAEGWIHGGEIIAAEPREFIWENISKGENCRGGESGRGGELCLRHR